MKIKVTVYLKSGGSVTTEVIGKSITELTEAYEDLINKVSGVIIHEQIGGNSVQMVPRDNVACIGLEVLE